MLWYKASWFRSRAHETLPEFSITDALIACEEALEPLIERPSAGAGEQTPLFQHTSPVSSQRSAANTTLIDWNKPVRHYPDAQRPGAPLENKDYLGPVRRWAYRMVGRADMVSAVALSLWIRIAPLVLPIGFWVLLGLQVTHKDAWSSLSYWLMFFVLLVLLAIIFLISARHLWNSSE